MILHDRWNKNAYKSIGTLAVHISPFIIRTNSWTKLNEKEVWTSRNVEYASFSFSFDHVHIPMNDNQLLSWKWTNRNWIKIKREC